MGHAQTLAETGILVNK